MTENPVNDAGDFYPSELMRRMMNWWWLVVLMVIAGGALGWLLSRVQKPIYESTSVITTAINFAYSGKLDDYEEDMLVTAVGDVIGSTKVFTRVVEDAAFAGIDLDETSILDGLTKSRQGFRWELSSRFHDPYLAQRINQIWLAVAMEGLEELRMTGIQGLDELAYQHAIESCFSQAVVVEPSSAYCDAENLKHLQTDIANGTASGSEKTLLTRLLISRVSFEVTQEPGFSEKPVRLRTNLTTLAGGAAGLMASIILFLLGYPKTRQQGS
jgi:hypothetical protein